MSIVCCSAPNKQYLDNIYDAIPLDSSSSVSVPALPNITVMTGKLATRDSRSGREFKPQIYQGKGRGQSQSNYDRCSYDQ